MERKIQISTFIFCAIVATYSYAYEMPTHERISEAALKNSVLFEADGVLKELGIAVPTETKSFKREDGTPAEGNERFHDFYFDKNTNNQRNVIGHVRLGSSYEDKKMYRWACAHFFDPVNDQPLDSNFCVDGVGGAITGNFNYRSPNWALYGVDANGNSMAEREDALIRDGVWRFRLALISADKTTREEYFGSLFRTLGQAIHHIQDMTQPEHTRNDAHIPHFTGYSLYEKYSNCKYTVLDPTQFPELKVNKEGGHEGSKGACKNTKPGDLPQEDYSELSLNEFNHARKFWETPDQDIDKGIGKGIAEFTNANFVSHDTNFRVNDWDPSVPINTLTFTHGEYPLPDPNNGDAGIDISSAMIEAPIPDGLGSGPDQPLRGEIKFFGTMVKDEYTGTTTPNPRTSSLSIFTRDLERYNVLDIGADKNPYFVNMRLFSLNRFTYDAAHDYLLPRAAAYSTGLINYFFRGRMEITKVVYPDDDKITITVKNVTADKNSDNAAYSFSDGFFWLYYDNAADNRVALIPDNWGGDVLLFGPELLENEDELSMSFKLPYIGGSLDIDLKKPFTLIFDGKIGHADMERSGWELGIAATTFYIEPLLSFDISRSNGNAPVPNIIDIYASYDLGLNWELVSETGIPVEFNDTTLDPSNRLGINAVTYIGNRKLLVYPDYLDYNNGTPGSNSLSIGSLRLSSYGAENILSGVSLDWATALGGAGNNISDNMAILRSLSATGSLVWLHSESANHHSLIHHPVSVPLNY
ncbi:MAG: hypothetical protein L3J22_04520 [Xanthomonadales bacterium]|nr:hypothetical protein [Xanthomonadales bacterium]